MILAGVGAESEVRAGERGAKFRDQFLGRVRVIAESLP